MASIYTFIGQPTRRAIATLRTPLPPKLKGNIMKSLIAGWILSTIAVLGFAIPAFATSGENSGTVATFGLVGSGGPPGVLYEVTINGLGTLCPGRNWAYIGTPDEFNSSQLIEAVSQAKYLGSNLYIFWTTDANGNCYITRAYY
jgi:hypothetical protein